MDHFLIFSSRGLQNLQQNVICAFLAVGLTLSAAVASAAPVQSIGKITLTVGQATITSAAGAIRRAQRGEAIEVGDRIETSLGGHVLVRFVDDALVSVRPSSELLVEDYKYDPLAADRSQVKFRLSRGAARAISGAAAEGARDKFRLNTPLVAIGIRGTDFVVHSDALLTTAAVNYGAIVMAPFGQGCAAQSSGPCATSAARLLTADMSGMLAEYRSGFAQAEIRPALGNNTTMPELPRTATAATGARSAAVASPLAAPGTQTTAAASGGGGSPAVAGLGEVASATPADFSRVPYQSNSLVDPDSASGGQLAATSAVAMATRSTALQPAVTDSPVKVDPPATVMPAVPVVPPASLAWGRWGTGPAGSDDFSVSRDDARSDRVATVGNTRYLLYRTAGDFDLAKLSAANQGQVGFALDKGFAQYFGNNGKVEAATVNGGILGINFAARQFNTSLDVNTAATGAMTLSASGAIASTGLFVAAQQDGSKVAGAIALDGKSVGYLFDKVLPAGTLSGITQWKTK